MVFIIYLFINFLKNRIIIFICLFIFGLLHPHLHVYSNLHVCTKDLDKIICNNYIGVVSIVLSGEDTQPYLYTIDSLGY